jgi:predicted phosphodiesterase
MSRELERAGVRFFLTHIPPPHAPTGVHVILLGHTHVPRDEMLDGVRWLNPGCITRPRGCPASYAWLEVACGKITAWSLMQI